jgi:hypothetical protein
MVVVDDDGEPSPSRCRVVEKREFDDGDSTRGISWIRWSVAKFKASQAEKITAMQSCTVNFLHPGRVPDMHS